MPVPYPHDTFCPACDVGVFEHDDARCDTCNRTRTQAIEAVEREVRNEEAYNAHVIERHYLRGIVAPDY